MMKKSSKKGIVALLLLLYGSCQGIYAQTITGKIFDTAGQPVDGATLVLQTIDSTYVEAALSNPDGLFFLRHQPEPYRLIVQHLLYQTKVVEGREKDAGTIVLESKDYALDEVVVKGERPFVKVEGGRLGYDLSRLAEDKVVNNAYEALAKLPGVQEKEGKLTLAGAGNVTVILNGKPTTMDVVQLETLLRNTPIDRVEKAEVMYSAPPQYHIRGAVINVLLKRSNDYSFQGEVSTQYTNCYFNGGGMNGNFRLSTPKIAFDVMYGAEDKKNIEYMQLHSKHTLHDQVYDINEPNRITGKYWNHNLRTALEYNLNEKNYINLSYTGNFSPRQHNQSQSTGNFQTSHVDKYIDTRMHNITFQYHAGFGLDLGLDYTHYTSSNDQTLDVSYTDETERNLNLSASQKIDRYAVYADQTHSVGEGWDIGYGASYKFANDRDKQIYNKVSGEVTIQNTDSKLKEQTTNFYLSLSKKYEAGLSLAVSATGEYYTIGDYHKWAVYPQATLTYQKTPRHIFQLSLATDKTYPSYWSMQSSISYVNGYAEMHGTPNLRPMTAYNLEGNYILKQKYIFGLFFQHMTDYFAQTAYQSTDRLALIYQYNNWNYMRVGGANVVLPFQAEGWLDSRLTLVGMQIHQRADDFYDLPFNRKKWVFSGSLDNTFKVYQGLALELNGFLQTPAIQGTFDITTLFNLTAGLKWNFAKEKATLSLRCSDIFETGMPNTRIRIHGQYLDMKNSFYTRAFTVHFSYRFGGYKKKEMKAVDTSRFGH